MKKIIILLLLLPALAQSQTGSIIRKYVEAIDSFKLHGVRVDSIAIDTTNWEFRPLSLTRAIDVYEFVKARATGGGGGSVSFGTARQIPFTNSTADDFNYNAQFSFDGTSLTVPDGASGAVGLKFYNAGGGNLGFYRSTSGALTFQVTTNNSLTLANNVARLGSAGRFSWSSTTNSTGADDLMLYRDAAGVLAQRNGTNAQEIRIYNTASGANSEFLGIGYISSANTIRFESKKNGTGIERAMEFVAPDLGFNGNTYFQTNNAYSTGGFQYTGRNSSTGRLETITNPRGAYFNQSIQSLTAGSTVTWDVESAGIATLVINQNSTLAFSNIGSATGGSLTLKITQDATGGRDLTLPSICKVPGGGGLTLDLSDTAGAVDIVEFKVISATEVLVILVKNFS